MIDPMAGIDAALPGPDTHDEKDVFDVTTLRYNLQHIDKIRSVMNIASGCVAGICGLTGLEGLGTLRSNVLVSSILNLHVDMLLVILLCI